MKKISLMANYFETKLCKRGFLEYDELSGGLADEKSIDEFDPKQLEIGTEIEYEHTADKEKAQEIASDHIAEHEDYYIGLDYMEKLLEELEKYNKNS